MSDGLSCGMNVVEVCHVSADLWRFLPETWRRRSAATFFEETTAAQGGCRWPTGVFASRRSVNPAVDDLLLAGFDPADIDIGKSRAPRRKFVAPEDFGPLLPSAWLSRGCLGAMISHFIVIGSSGTIVSTVISAPSNLLSQRLRVFLQVTLACWLFNISQRIDQSIPKVAETEQAVDR